MTNCLFIFFYLLFFCFVLNFPLFYDWIEISLNRNKNSVCNRFVWCWRLSGHHSYTNKDFLRFEKNFTVSKLKFEISYLVYCTVIDWLIECVKSWSVNVSRIESNRQLNFIINWRKLVEKDSTIYLSSNLLK